jgi:4-hydroxybenzoate polyprenyltransferase
MGAVGPRIAAVDRRPRWRAYVLLARVSNLPTVWTNVLAGVVLAGAVVSPGTLFLLIAALSSLYVGGMFLNDAFDRDADAALRPERPIPAGDVAASEAFAAGGLLIAAGLALLAGSPRPAAALAWGAGLAVAIVYYDYRHKRNPVAPLVMGLCRAGVYAVAAAATAHVTAPVAVGALVLAGYVAAFTYASRAGWIGPSVPWLIAGISLVDAVLIAVAGHVRLAAAVTLGFVLTLAFQRVVPGD